MLGHFVPKFASFFDTKRRQLRVFMDNGRDFFAQLTTYVAVGLFLGFNMGAPATAAPTVLYDSSLSNRPDEPNWNWPYWAIDANSGTVEATNSFTSGATELRTTFDNADRAGFTEYVPLFGNTLPGAPALDRTTGFELSLTMQIIAEHHLSADRAGFSLIAMTDSPTNDPLGVEIAFWEDEIWAQDVGFTHSATERNTSWDPKANLTTYRLRVQGGAYQLFADQSQLFSGNLKNYDSTSPPLTDVYDRPNYLFFGDNTASAGADVRITEITFSPIPEPNSFVLASFALVVLVWRPRRVSAG
jgi:hypothetical protein